MAYIIDFIFLQSIFLPYNRNTPFYPFSFLLTLRQFQEVVYCSLLGFSDLCLLFQHGSIFCSLCIFPLQQEMMLCLSLLYFKSRSITFFLSLCNYHFLLLQSIGIHSKSKKSANNNKSNREKERKERNHKIVVSIIFLI